MFRELSELEHVFEQLKNDSELPIRNNLSWICGKKSEFNRRLTPLMKTVYNRELTHGITPGKSYQSKILSDLHYYLETCAKSSKLKAHLPELKELLFKAYVISLDQRIDSIKQFSYAKNQLAEHGNRFRGNKRGRNKLSNLLLEVLRKHGKDAPACKIINELNELANEGHELIHEVDDEYIYWYSGKKDKRTSIKRVYSAISNLRKSV